ncbi:PREDICTED: polyadenylate-binding protein-interacting protein 10-like [Tarenaya hassleriana]|uniref:polyadenylate-binding protein-interacting protein 10-like n=1 Tax=Tarenaya hassleriana TaxID=28532 RepID=UPI00053C8283|nr:PREDICTED: polyadenylate-binding protein-interacting protein 10-like [Tarenaya hassleriana]
MAVAENAGVKVDSSGQNLENNTVSAAGMKPPCPDDQNPKSDSSGEIPNPTEKLTPDDDDREVSANGTDKIDQTPTGFKENGFGSKPENGTGGDSEENLKREIGKLDEMLSRLNPMAEEFVPPSLARNQSRVLANGLGFTNGFAGQANSADGNGHFARRRRNNGQGKRRMNKRTSMAQREEIIGRTVYVADIDQQVTEEQLAGLFLNCGQVVDCRVCGDPNSVLRFAFIEFTDAGGARAALSMSGTMLGFYPVRVLPSKTAIAPVNPTFLPRSEDEREMCSRTVYCTNIDNKISQADLKLFFESICGEVRRLRLLGDYHHQTRIAFVEFMLAESAIAALNCSGVIVGGLPVRVSPSKTPVRPRLPRPQFN